MRIAHLILAHKNPLQLEHLINSLEHPYCDCYIHLDKKTAIDDFLYLSEKKNIFFISNRISIHWAGYGTIQATLNGFTEIIKTERYSYINVISAQDLPLQPASKIYEFIKHRPGKEFITCENVETEWAEAKPRIKKYHLINWRIPGKYRLEKLVNLVLPERNPPLGLTIVGRANWFTITLPAAIYILTFINKHPSYIRFFKYCWGADEFFFSTILYNSGFKSQIENNLVYVDWTEAKNGHPKVFTTKDYNQLITSGKLFARKFDMITDPGIFELLADWRRHQ